MKILSQKPLQGSKKYQKKNGFVASKWQNWTSRNFGFPYVFSVTPTQSSVHLVAGLASYTITPVELVLEVSEFGYLWVVGAGRDSWRWTGELRGETMNLFHSKYLVLRSLCFQFSSCCLIHSFSFFLPFWEVWEGL